MMQRHLLNHQEDSSSLVHQDCPLKCVGVWGEVILSHQTHGDGVLLERRVVVVERGLSMDAARVATNG